MWFKKLKKKKLQCFLIGSLLFLSSLIFASSLSLITSVKGYIDKYYANEKFYNITVFNSNDKATKDVEQWCRNNSEILDVKTLDGYTSGNDLYLNHKNMKLASYSVVALEDMENLPFGINKVKSSNETSCPKDGEVWVTQLLADNFKIALGDKLTFKGKDKEIVLKITSLINDSLQPSSTSSGIIVYTNKSSAEKLSFLMKSPFIFINAKKGVELSKLEKDLNTMVKVGGYTADKDLLIMSSSTASSLIGGICTLASLLVFIVSVLLIRFILWNNIIKEYKSIGIYKALGFNKKEIIKFYIIGYSLTAIIGSILGAVCSIPILNYTADKILKYIGNFQGIDINFTVIIATVVLFSLVVIVNLYFVIRRTNKISPVEALRTGVTSSKKKLTKSLIKNANAPLTLAVNDMFKYKKVSVFITLALTLSLTLVLLFGNIYVSISKMREKTNVWFGVGKSDVTISAALCNPEGALREVVKEVNGDNRVENYVYGSISYTGIVLDTKAYHLKSSLYSVAIMNSYDNNLGFTLVEGRNPKSNKEAAVSLRILEESGLSIGDYIELSINNKKACYLITGSYSSMMSNGYSLRILSTAIKKEVPNFIGTELFVNLKDPSQIEGFKKDINDKFVNLEASDIHPLMKYIIASLPEILLPITYLLMAVFIAFCSITILNIIMMNLRDNRRSFGIMKSLGFTTKEIRNRYLYRIIILTSFSTILAVIFNLTAARPMIAASVRKMDILIISPKVMLLLLTAMILLIISITLICCRAIKNTKPTELMEE